MLEDDDAADAVAVPVEELRRAVQHDIGAEGERALDIRAGKGVVDDDADVLAMRDGAHALDVGDVQHRVGRRLDEQVFRVRLQRRLDELGLRGVDVGEIQAELPAHALEQPERSAIGVVADEHVIAGFESRQERIDGRHA